MPLRIAQLCADRGIAPGGTKGASSHLRGMVRGFQALGHEVVTYAARGAEGDFPAPVRPLEALLGAEADLIYERYSLAHLSGLRQARARGIPLVLEVNAPLVLEAQRYRPETLTPEAEAAERELLNEADLVVAVSHPLAAWIAERRTGPVAVVPNGFEPDWFTSAPAPEDGLLAFCGHPKPWHGTESLVPLLQALHARGTAARLLVIGGGPGADALAGAAEAAGLGSHVTVTGGVPPQRAAALLSRAAIGLAPYPSSEHFYFSPLKILDYLAAGIPTVATALGDVPGLVGDAGRVVAPEDHEAFADEVARLLADPEQRAAMGARGRSRAHASMTWTHAASATLDALAAATRRAVPVSAGGRS